MIKVDISVVIPVHNAELYIRQCLDSVLRQEVPLEIICVDDNSTDRSCETIEEYIKAGCPVKLLRNKTNERAGFCRNKGIDASQGKYIHFLDADDFLVEGAYKKLLAIANKENADVLRCNAYVYDNVTGMSGETDYYSHKRLSDNVFGKVYTLLDRAQSMLQGVVAPWAGIIKRDFVISKGLRFNHLMCVNDRSFYFESLIKARRIIFVKEFIIYYRQNNSHSLIGNRSKFYSCQFESYKIVERLAKLLPPTLQVRLLELELSDIARWMLTFRSSPLWKECICNDLKKFLANLDYKMIGRNYKMRPWYREFDRIFELEDLECRNSAYPYKVSVIIPMYNAGNYLMQCLKSLRLQTFRNAEFICVDDGSTDDTCDIVSQFQSEDSRFVLLHQNHLYAGQARNLGIERARGECLAFLDADDYYELDFLEQMVKARIKEKADVIVCGANLYYGRTNTKVPATWYVQRGKSLRGKCSFSPHLHPDVVFNFTPGNPWNKLFSRAFVQRNKLSFSPTRRSEDIAFVYPALALASKITLVDKCLVNYRIDNSSSLEHTKSETPLEFYDAYIGLRDDLRRRHLLPKFYSSFIQRVALAFLYNLNKMVDFNSFKEVYFKIKQEGISEFELLQGVPTSVDAQLRAISSYSPEDYLVRRNLELSDKISFLQKKDNESVHNGGARGESSGRSKQLSIALLSREVEELKASEAYRIGMLITSIPRFIWRFFKRHN